MEPLLIINHACREHCAACCIAPSISSSIPGMENGKAANTPCIQLDENLLCKIFNSPLRPSICHNFKFDRLICGNSREEAIQIMKDLEKE